MSRRCELTKKGPQFGHQISHAHNVTKVKFLPNLQKKRFYIPSAKKWVKLKVSTRALRTMNLIGVEEYIRREKISI